MPTITMNKLATPYEMILTVKKDELNKALDDKWEQIKNDIELDGFEKGQVPKEEAEKHLFDEIYNDVLPMLFAQEIKKNNLTIIHNYDIRTKGEFKRDNDILVLSKVYLFPEIEVPQNFEFKNNTNDLMVTDQEVENYLNEIKYRGQPYESVKRPAQTNDQVIIDFTGYIDGKVFKNGDGKAYPLVLGSNTFIAGFEEQLLATKIGETVTVKVTFPQDYAGDVAGKKADFVVYIKDIKSRKALLSSDLYNIYDVSDMEGLKAKLADDLLQKKNELHSNESKARILQTYVDSCRIDPIPHEYIDSEINKHFKNSLENMNMDEETLSKKIPNARKIFHAQQRARIVNQIKSTFVIEKIVRDKNIVNTELEIDNYLIEKYSDKEVAKFNLDNNSKRLFADSQIKIQKALNYIYDFAN